MVSSVDDASWTSTQFDGTPSVTTISAATALPLSQIEHSPITRKMTQWNITIAKRLIDVCSRTHPTHSFRLSVDSEVKFQIVAFVLSRNRIKKHYRSALRICNR